MQLRSGYTLPGTSIGGTSFTVFATVEQ